MWCVRVIVRRPWSTKAFCAIGGVGGSHRLIVVIGRAERVFFAVFLNILSVFVSLYRKCNI